MKVELGTLISVLQGKIQKVVVLGLEDGERRDLASSFLTEIIDNFKAKLEEAKNEEDKNRAVSQLVGKVLAIMETCGFEGQQYKSSRKLVLNEIYSFKDSVLQSMFDEGDDT